MSISWVGALPKSIFLFPAKKEKHIYCMLTSHIPESKQTAPSIMSISWVGALLKSISFFKQTKENRIYCMLSLDLGICCPCSHPPCHVHGLEVGWSCFWETKPCIRPLAVQSGRGKNGGNGVQSWVGCIHRLGVFIVTIRQLRVVRLDTGGGSTKDRFEVCHQMKH